LLGGEPHLQVAVFGEAEEHPKRSLDVVLALLQGVLHRPLQETEYGLQGILLGVALSDRAGGQALREDATLLMVNEDRELDAEALLRLCHPLIRCFRHGTYPALRGKG